jgi:hypothetical protein
MNSGKYSEVVFPDVVVVIKYNPWKALIWR